MDRWQPCYLGKLLGRLAMIVVLLATVEAGLSSSGLRLWPQFGLLPTMTFAFDGPDAAASSDTMYAGLFDWFKSKPKAPPPPPPDPEKPRRDQLRHLQALHDRVRDPAEKIKYDRQIIELLNPDTDFEKIRVLKAEIQQHEKEIRDRDNEQQKAEAISRAKQALEDKSYEEAERQAETAIQIFDDAEARQLRDEARTRRLSEEAKDLLAAKEVDKAIEKIQQALQLTPTDAEGQKIKKDIDNIFSKRKTLFVLKIAFMVLLVAGMLTVLYFLLRTRQWLLEGVNGPCQEKIFPLDKDEIKIGALGRPHGECDIVIRDAGHRISPLHCLIVRSGRHWYLMNESTNGTMINDEEVEKGNMVRLRKRDRLSLADEAVLVLRSK
jgi:predicted component of type VI protein secretion system